MAQELKRCQEWKGKVGVAVVVVVGKRGKKKVILIHLLLRCPFLSFFLEGEGVGKGGERESSKEGLLLSLEALTFLPLLLFQPSFPLSCLREKGGWWKEVVGKEGGGGDG